MSASQAHAMSFTGVMLRGSNRVALAAAAVRNAPLLP